MFFYGSNQTYNTAWGTEAMRRMEIVRAWYKEQLNGETFELNSLVTMQGNSTWQYYDADEWARVQSELISRGEHIWGTGHIYMVFVPWGGFAGAAANAADPWNSGFGIVGNFASLAHERSEDCNDGARRNCAYTPQLGAVAHELGHALNLDTHEAAPPGYHSLLDFEYFPNLVLTSAQKTGLLASSGFIAPASGSTPAAPSTPALSAVSGGNLQGCQTDNSPAETYYYFHLEQATGTDVNSALFREPFVFGSGSNFCRSNPAWPRPGASSNWYHLRVWAQGSGGNSGRAESNPYWAWSGTPTAPNSTSTVYMYGTAQGYPNGMFACWYDRASDEDGFLVQQIEQGSPDVVHNYLVRGPAAGGSPSNPVWACQWVDPPFSGNWKTRVWAFKEGSSSSGVTSSAVFGNPWP